MKASTKNTGIVSFKVSARLQGTLNKHDELPLVIRYTSTKDGKTVQNIKYLKPRVTPADFDDKAGVLKSNAPAANTVNALIASRSHLLRTAASEANDAGDWNEVGSRYEALVTAADTEAVMKRVSKRLKVSIMPTWQLEDAVADKHRIEKEQRQNEKELAELAAKGFNAYAEQVAYFVEKLDNYPTSFIISGPKVINQINSWINNLKRFSKETNTLLTFDNMNKAFYKSYGDWILIKEKNYNNWFGACVKRLKTFLNKCVADGITVNPAFQTFKVLAEKKEVIYLSIKELDLVWNYEGNEVYRKYQDLCVFGNITGLRVGDILNSTFRIDDEMLIGRNTKNETDFFIPLATDHRIEEILTKYNFNLGVVSEQKYNKYIKELLKEIFAKHNINQTEIKLFHTQWKQKVPYKAYKHELISNHSSRRGFVTNMYNVHKYTVDDIKAMLGSTSNEILKYLVVEKVAVKEKAQEKLKAKQAEILAKAKKRVV